MYKINYKNIKINYLIEFLNIFVSAAFIIISRCCEYGDDVTRISFLVVTVLLCFYSLYVLYRIVILTKHVKKIKYLSTYGTLVKNLSYETKHLSTMRVLWRLIDCVYIIVDYQTKYGEKIHFKSKLFFIDPYDKYDAVDVLYDPSNPQIFYIDFNIEKNDKM